MFFQNAIAMHESNGIDIIVALLLIEIKSLGKNRIDLVLELKVRLNGKNFIQNLLVSQNLLFLLW